MNKAKINELYEKAYVTYEVPYESSVVDPTIVSIHKQRVWDRHLFAELIVRECISVMDTTAKEARENFTYMDNDVPTTAHQFEIRKHFGVEK